MSVTIEPPCHGLTTSKAQCRHKRNFSSGVEDCGYCAIHTSQDLNAARLKQQAIFAGATSRQFLNATANLGIQPTLPTLTERAYPTSAKISHE